MWVNVFPAQPGAYAVLPWVVVGWVVVGIAMVFILPKPAGAVTR